MAWDDIWGWSEELFLWFGSFSGCLDLEAIKVLSRVFFFWGYPFFSFMRSCLHLALKVLCSESLRSDGSLRLIVNIFLNSLLSSCSSLSLLSSNPSYSRTFLSLCSSIFSLFSSSCNLSLSIVLSFSFSFSSSILMYSILGSLFVFKYNEKRSSCWGLYQRFEWEVTSELEFFSVDGLLFPFRGDSQFYAFIELGSQIGEVAPFSCVVSFKCKFCGFSPFSQVIQAITFSAFFERFLALFAFSFFFVLSGNKSSVLIIVGLQGGPSFLLSFFLDLDSEWSISFSFIFSPSLRDVFEFLKISLISLFFLIFS